MTMYEKFCVDTQDIHVLMEKYLAGGKCLGGRYEKEF